MKALLAFIGILMVLFGLGWNINLVWIQHPEMTNRMLWLTFPWQCLGSTLMFITGPVLILFGIHDA